MMEAVKTKNAPAAIGPYSQAIKLRQGTGGLIYTSGQIPIVPETGQVIEGGIEVQAVQVLENMKNVLEAAGSGLSRVLKTTVFIKDMTTFAAINEIYAKYFNEPFPSRSCVEVARLPKDVLIEIEAVAIAY